MKAVGAHLGIGRRLRRLAGCTRGDVLLEYVIITTAILLPLVGVTNGLFNPSGDWDYSANARLFNVSETLHAAEPDFGVFGNAMVGWWQRVMCGCAQPVP